MSSRWSRSGAARRLVISSVSSASSGARMRPNTRWLARGPASTANIISAGLPSVSSIAAEALAQAVVAAAEDGAHDHLERQRLRARAGLDQAQRPRRDLLRGDLADRLAVGLHPLAVERRQHRLALGHVLRAVEQQHAVRAEQRLEDRVALTRVQDVRVAREHPLDVIGMRHHHPRHAPVHVQRERVAVALAQPPDVRPGPQHPAGRVHDVRLRRPRREAVHHSASWRSITPAPDASSPAIGSDPANVPKGCS